MGFFDFLSNKNDSMQPYNPAASPDANDGMLNASSMGDMGGFDAKKLFSDPNFIQALGSAGAGISAGQPIGQAVGGAATNWSRNKAMQTAATKQMGGQNDRMKMLLEAIGTSGLVTPTTDNSAADWIKVDGDKGWTMGMKYKPQMPTAQGEQPSLESQPNRSSMSSGNTQRALPNFL